MELNLFDSDSEDPARYPEEGTTMETTGILNLEDPMPQSLDCSRKLVRSSMGVKANGLRFSLGFRVSTVWQLIE